jgi:chaperonin cofactor prefoldin
MKNKGIGNKSLVQNIQATLEQSIELLQDLKAQVVRDQALLRTVDNEVINSLSVVLPLLPPEVQEQVHKLLELQNDIKSPYLGRATTMTQLHHRNEHRPDLPGWAQPEE